MPFYKYICMLNLVLWWSTCSILNVWDKFLEIVIDVFVSVKCWFKTVENIVLSVISLVLSLDELVELPSAIY